jgi:hypothetical protein
MYPNLFSSKTSGVKFYLLSLLDLYYLSISIAFFFPLESQWKYPASTCPPYWKPPTLKITKVGEAINEELGEEFFV